MDDSKIVTVTPAGPVHIWHGALILAVEVPTPTLGQLFEVDKAGEAGLRLELPCVVTLRSGIAAPLPAAATTTGPTSLAAQA